MYICNNSNNSMCTAAPAAAGLSAPLRLSEAYTERPTIGL